MSLPSVNFSLYLDPEKIKSQEEHDQIWNELNKRLSERTVELQYEMRFDLNYWRSLPQILKGNVTTVHAPIKGKDIASEDKKLRAWSIEEYKRSMDLAILLEAKYFIVHLTPQDDFEDRDSQLQRGLEALEEISSYRSLQGYRNLQILIEVLEYPKWPSNLEETTLLLQKIKPFLPDVGVCLDVAHLWHNFVALRPDKDASVDFPEKLSEFLFSVSRQAPIKVIHLAGAYIEYVDGKEEHITHGIPGLMPGEVFTSETNLNFSFPPGFNGDWMEIDAVLKTIVDFVRNEEELPLITIEVHEQDTGRQMLACEKIHNRLVQIVEDERKR